MAKARLTKEQRDKVFEIISTTNKGVRAVCKEIGIGTRTLYDELIEFPEFQQQYARAKQLQADILVEEILEISDDSSNDTIHTEKGDFEDKEWTNRSRLRVDSRKWLASKLLPKVYGDKIEHDHKMGDVIEVSIKRKAAK